ncbi:flagellar biosynthesis anti-sigma factor FlgM [Shewanella dokdonensis]|uniref:Negative regulator of flagellin synthesis n=1 Tax=Shewanella dokdonensis TaxID=712036 RepID=A0ABX8DDD6_9GAMM|nr:flagellar biosynthesis anti-sigma factor FlgM [Shewanella dokdonensis]MCL1073483.1 flagellar biosynthesis anti-sigma factor FlgM [Shewanella dokdonensis]QVK22728.1 flagellar biosynthesis anti-sigma factor FlgM [Shewanella dokdonensis]
MKISNQGIIPLDNLKADTPSTGKQPLPGSGDTAKTEVNNAQLSALSRSAGDVYAGLSEQDEVDMDKVMAMRSAIEKGQLPLDEEALVNAIMDMHRL